MGGGTGRSNGEGLRFRIVLLFAYFLGGGEELRLGLNDVCGGTPTAAVTTGVYTRVRVSRSG